MTTDVVIIDAARTPHGELLGSLAPKSAVDLGAAAVDGLRDRRPVADELDWLVLGNAIQAGVGQVPARQVAVSSGLSDSVPATTVNEASGSGLRALALAVDRLRAGVGELAIAGGMESMSNAPYLVPDLRSGRRMGDAELVDAMIHDALWDPNYDAHMGELTERLADRFDISRADQDEYTVESNHRATRAIENDRFAGEMVEVAGLDRDEGPRADSTREALAALDPVFAPDGTITAGNASSLSDGAGTLLIGTPSIAATHDLVPLVGIEDYAVSYTDPKWFGISVGDAVESVLERNGMTVEDIDHFELNEAFAAQMVYVRDRLDIPQERLNPLGGAVALGHPIGASGGILATTIAHEMAHKGHEWGIVGMSIGGGGGIAMLLRGIDD